MTTAKTAYERAMTFPKTEQGTRKGTIDPSWHTGRGSFGGLIAAATMRAMIEELADAERVPRALTVHFCAPPVGEIELTTEIVRGGAKVTHLATRVVAADGKVAAFASGSFCKTRTNLLAYQHATMPAFEPASAVAPRPQTLRALPEFLQYFDIRFCGGAIPYSSSPDAVIPAWVRLREAVPIDAPVLAMLLDLLPAGITATLDRPVAVASVDFTMQLFAREPFGLDPEQALLTHIRSRWAGDGYTEEMRDLWTADGVLLGQCRQLMAIV